MTGMFGVLPFPVLPSMRIRLPVFFKLSKVPRSIPSRTNFRSMLKTMP